MTGPFTWDDRTGRYRNSAGRFVSRAEVRGALDWAIDRMQQRMFATGEDLRAGRISLEQWRQATARDLKDLHLYSAAAARGGWAQMTPADYGRVGRELRDQYKYLNNFAQQIASGAQPLDGRFVNRLRLYAQSGRVTYHKADDAVQADLGMTEERNVLHPAEHCSDCLDETALGWVPIGTLTPIGQRKCLSNDKCTKEFRATEDTSTARDPLEMGVDEFTPANRDGHDTLERFTRKDGTLTPQRQRLHDAIVEKYLAGHRPVDDPIVNVMGGGPASGKSVLLSKMGTGNHGVHIDVDEVRALLPEYVAQMKAGSTTAAAFTHEEASMIGKRITAGAVEQRFNFVADGTGNSSIESLSKKIAGYRANGAKVVGNYVTVDTETAYQRMLNRGRETGRYVPETYLRQVHGDVSKVFQEAVERGLFDEFQLWDTNGGTPIKVASGAGKTLVIHDEAAWLRFLAKQHERP